MREFYKMVGLNYEDVMESTFKEVIEKLSKTKHQTLAYIVWEDIKDRIRREIKIKHLTY